MSPSLLAATARAVAASVEAAARLAEAGDMDGAERAIKRAEARYDELRAVLPGHSRLVRQSAESIAMARRALAAPKVQENDETGELVPLRERLLHRAGRASVRARA